jgi:hypothetical protein
MTNLYPWYLIPIVAVLAMRANRLGLVYLFAATALALAYYPAYVYTRVDVAAVWSELQRHLFLAQFLTVPMLAFLAAELVAGRFPHRQTDLAKTHDRIAVWLRASPAPGTSGLLNSSAEH